jgi:hypothetical protein
MRVVLIASLALTLFAGIGGTVRAAASGAGPVQVLDCRINRRLAFVDPYRSATVTFANRDGAVADAILFSIEYAGQTANLTDRGAFAKDVNVEHDFRAFWNVPFVGPAPAKCAVLYVHFADGSSWPAGVAP